MPGLTGHLPSCTPLARRCLFGRLRFRRPGGLYEGERWPGGSVRWRSLRTLPPFPASPLRGNLSPAGPVFPWPRGATPPAHLPPLLSSRARHSGYPPADYGAGNGRAGEEGRWARAHRTRLARRRRAPLSRGGGACLEGHVQECISVAVFVHVTELQSGAMNIISIPGLFMYMTLQTTSSLINFFVTSGIIAHQGQNSWQPYSCTSMDYDLSATILRSKKKHIYLVMNPLAATRFRHGKEGARPLRPGWRRDKTKSPGLTIVSPGLRRTAATYSPTWWGSTIGDGGLNFSVRNGKRWIPTAITTAICFLRENNFSSGTRFSILNPQILSTALSHSLSQRKISGN